MAFLARADLGVAAGWVGSSHQDAEWSGGGCRGYERGVWVELEAWGSAFALRGAGMYWQDVVRIAGRREMTRQRGASQLRYREIRPRPLSTIVDGASIAFRLLKSKQPPSSLTPKAHLHSGSS